MQNAKCKMSNPYPARKQNVTTPCSLLSAPCFFRLANQRGTHYLAPIHFSLFSLSLERRIIRRRPGSYSLAGTTRRVSSRSRRISRGDRRLTCRLLGENDDRRAARRHERALSGYPL